MIGTTRRHLTALTVATAVVALAACAPSSSSTSGSSSGGSDGKGVTLSVWSWRTEDVAAYDAIFDVYEKAHPGVKVDFKAFKNTEYNQILTTGLAGSNGPDVVQVRSYGQLQPTIASGSLVPLDSTVDLSSWDANVVKSAEGKEDGKLYAVPLAQQTLQMFYNKDLFAKQGLTPPTTWKQFIEVNARLKEQGITPMAVGAKDSWTLPIVHQVLAAPRFGGAAFEKAVLSGQKTFTDPDWVASVDVLKALKPYLPDSAVGVAYTDAQILFTSGKAAMFPGGSFELGFFQKQNPALKMGVFQVPPPAGSPTTAPTTTGYADGAFGVSTRSDAQQASKDLVAWMATKEFGQLVADKVKQLSAVPGVTYTDPLLKQMADSYARNPSPYLLLVDFRYGTPSGTDVLGTGLQELLLGKKDAAAVSDDLQTGVSQWFKPSA
jgi:raffinose/stachyose/melibiose transport system substrate-binding protein